MVYLKICKIPNEIKEDINQNIRLKNVNETPDFFLEEVDQNELLSKKHKQKVFYTCKSYWTLSYYSFRN